MHFYIVYVVIIYDLTKLIKLNLICFNRFLSTFYYEEVMFLLYYLVNSRACLIFIPNPALQYLISRYIIQFYIS